MAAARSGRHRALKLDAVALGIVQVDRRSLALGAVAGLLLAAMDAVPGEMLGDRLGVERLDAQAQMIEIGAAGRRRAGRRPRFVGGLDVDQGVPGAQLSELVLALLEGAAQ